MKRCSICHLLGNLMRNHNGFLMDLTDEMSLMMTIENHPEKIEEATGFPCFERLMRIDESMRKQGINIRGTYLLKLRDMTMQEIYSDIRSFAQNPVDRFYGVLNYGVLSANWGTGGMNVEMDSFFPCEVKRLQKVMRLIKLDPDHEKIICGLRTFFEKKSVALPIEREFHRRRFVNLDQLYRDIKRNLEANAYPNGVKMTKSEAAYYANELHKIQSEVRQHMREYKRCGRDKEWFDKNIRRLF